MADSAEITRRASAIRQKARTFFSSPIPIPRTTWGYKDSWLGADRYRYYGEWNGTGDMLMRGGNLAIVERSPEIYLFVKAPNGHRFQGRFAFAGETRTPATREGREYSALVFTLERAASRQT